MTIQCSLRNVLRLLAGGRIRHHLAPVAAVDLGRFMGPWRVLAVMDNPLERHFADAVETYRLRPKDRIAVTFQWREGSLSAPLQTHGFTGRVTDPGRNAVWKMNVFPLMAAKYVIIGLDDEYAWAAIGHPSRRFAWILSRTPSIPSSVMERIYDRFRDQGFDTAKLRAIPHPATQTA